MIYLTLLLSFAWGANNEACEALCIRDSFDGGKAYKKGCICFQIKEDYESFLKARIRLGIKNPLEHVIVITGDDKQEE